MTTSRIRNYVKKNPETIERWKDDVLKKHIIRELTDKYGTDDLKDSEGFNIQSITRHAGQNKICADILYDHYDLAFEVSKESTTGSFRHTGKSLHLSEKTFEEMTKDIGVKPVFDTVDTDKIYEDDIYTLIKNLSLQNLAYIYYHQDEFCYIDKKSSYRSWNGSRDKEGLGVFWKEQKEEADNMAFRNALDKYYEDKLNVVGKIVCDKDLPDLVEVETEYDDDSFNSSAFSGYHQRLLPHTIDELDKETLDVRIAEAEYGIKKFQRTLDQLKELRSSILEAGGAQKFREMYYEKMLANFYQNLPLFINVEDENLKSLAKRAMKRKFT